MASYFPYASEIYEFSTNRKKDGTLAGPGGSNCRSRFRAAHRSDVLDYGSLANVSSGRLICAFHLDYPPSGNVAQIPSILGRVVSLDWRRVRSRTGTQAASFSNHHISGRPLLS